jgi:glutamate-ammonia-ligase adenylyltransferase
MSLTVRGLCLPKNMAFRLIVIIQAKTLPYSVLANWAGLSLVMDLIWIWCFLYDCQDGIALTDGEKPISCSQFYGRLGLKVRHILDTKLLSGVLYDVDMRLRPSGDSGLLVSHINAYEDYLKNQAWTWEHQALVRGRFIAGDPRLKAEYEAIRHRILSMPRDPTLLKTEIRKMREKMRDALATKESNKFDLKQSKGGIADIEFIVQFGVLARAAKNRALTTYTDNVRLLEGLQADGFMSEKVAKTLKTAYCTYRDYGHKLVLQGDRALIDEAEVVEMSAQVEQIWHDFMNKTGKQKIQKLLIYYLNN